MQTPCFDELTDAWKSAEEPFAANMYEGAVLPGTVHLHPGDTGAVFTAPHAVSHWRETRSKLADLNTGGMAMTLAASTGSTALVQAGAALRDGNWYEYAEFKGALRAELPTATAVLDLHGMRDNYGVDVCIGLGQDPAASGSLVQVVHDHLESAGLVVAVNDPFDAAFPGTVTSFCQRAGVPAVQLEMSRTVRTPGTAQSLAVMRALWAVAAQLRDTRTTAPALLPVAVAAHA